MADSRLDVLIKGKDELTPELKRVESGVIRAVGAISAALAAIKIGIAPIKAAADFEQEMANVARTTGFASKAFDGQIGKLDELGAALIKMSLRVNVTAIDLAKIASLAGQLGFSDKFGVEGVVKFTDSVARMASTLGIPVEEAANNIGKIINIFKVATQDIEKAVSTILLVSNKSTASGAELLDVIKRIGDAAGSLNLQQSAALAATGIDLGLSPEVVGTAFSKVFSAFRVGADKFAILTKGVALETGKVLKGSTDEWIQLVQDDGIGAFKAYLAGLRKLEAVSQQTAIVKLTGGGRIGALLNKLVQDTSDSVLNKSLQAAKDGAVGTAAIEAQLKTMFTLNTQMGILKNSITALGIDSGSPALAGLAQLAAQLSEALQTPQIKSFINAVVAGLTGLVKDIAKVVSVVGGMNVNWENFIKLLKVFLELKLAQGFISILTNIKLFGVSLKSISRDAELAAAANNKLGTAAEKAAAAQALAARQTLKDKVLQAAGLDTLIKKTRELQAATAAQRAAAAQIGPANATANTAAGTVIRSTFAAAATAAPAAAALAAATAQREALNAVLAKSTATALALTNAKNTSIERAEKAHTVKMLDIDVKHEARKAEIAATGTRVGLTEARAAYASAQAIQEASHARSIRGISTYYDTRLAVQATAAAAEIKIERSILAEKLLLQRTAVGKNNVAQSAATGAVAGAALAGAGAQAAAVAAAKLSQDVSAAKSAVFSFGSLYTAFAGIVAAAGRVIMSGFLWITVVYSLLDATGVLDKFGFSVQKLTDFFGLTSVAARDAKIKIDGTAQAAKEAAAEFEKAAEAYGKYTDKLTGGLDQKQVDESLKQQQANPDRSEQIAIGTELINTMTALGKGVENNKQKAEAFTEQIRKMKTEAALASAELAKLGSPSLSPAFKFLPELAQEAELAQLDKDIARIAALKAELDKIKNSMPSFEQGIAGSATEIARLTKNLEDLAKNYASSLTAESAKMLDIFGPAASLLKAQMDEATTRLNAQKALAKDGVQGASRQVLEATADITRITKKQNELNTAISDFIKNMKSIPGIPPVVLRSFEFLSELLVNLPTAGINALLGLIGKAPLGALAPQPVPPAAFSGTTVPNPPPKATGTDKVNLKNTGESKKDKEHALALARLALVKSDLEAINKVSDEADRQLSAQDQDRYDRGLTSIRDYYEERKTIQLNANQADINIKKAELAQAELELAKAIKEKRVVDELKFQASVNAIKGVTKDGITSGGEIALLDLKRRGIEKETAIQQRKDEDAFKARVRSETSRLQTDGIIPTDSEGLFKASLDAALEQHKEFLAKLVAQGEGKLEESMIAGFRLDAFKASLSQVSAAASLANGQLSRDTARISAAQARGSITAAEADKIHTAAIEARIPVLEEELRAYERTFEVVRANAALSPQRIAEFQAEIDAKKLALEQLREEQDKVAKSINKSLSDSIGSALDDLTTATGSISDIFKKLLYNIANSIRKIFVDDLTSRIGKSLGLDGSGGVGGYFSDVLARGPSGSANASVPGVAATAATAATDAATTAADVATKSAETAAVTAATGALGAFTGAIAAAPTGVVTSFSIVSGVIETTLLPILGTLTTAAGAAALALEAIAAKQAASTLSSLLVPGLHTGGIAGIDRTFTRAVSPMLFAGARRMHTGGVAGLSASEVPAILQKGEAVLTKNQQSLVAASLEGGGKSAPMNIRNVLVTDPNFVSDAMASSQGEKVLMTFIQRNRASIRQSLG